MAFFPCEHNNTAFFGGYLRYILSYRRSKALYGHKTEIRKDKEKNNASLYGKNLNNDVEIPMLGYGTWQSPEATIYFRHGSGVLAIGCPATDISTVPLSGTATKRAWPGTLPEGSIGAGIERKL